MVGGGSTAFGNLDVRAQLRAIKLKLASVATRQDAMELKMEQKFEAAKAQEIVTAEAKWQKAEEKWQDAEERARSMVTAILSMNRLVAEGSYDQNVAIAIEDMLDNSTDAFNSTYTGVFTNVVDNLLPFYEVDETSGAPPRLVDLTEDPVDELDTYLERAFLAAD